jgi:hypothetical protein
MTVDSSGLLTCQSIPVDRDGITGFRSGDCKDEHCGREDRHASPAPGYDVLAFRIVGDR